MKVGVGFSDTPDSRLAGVTAAQSALQQGGREEPCDLVLLFATARHNQELLREAVVTVVGSQARILGGGAPGVITNDFFGYAGDQVGLACIWLEGSRIDTVFDGGLLGSEQEVGARLGQGLAQLGVTPTSPVMLFYDAADNRSGEVRLIMATWLLEGLKQTMGFLPDLTGAGMMGDHALSPAAQYIGDTMGEHYAMALSFSEDIHIDSAIMHGCRPASQYFTVTKARGPVILEINHTPAINFIDNLLGSSIAPEEYPFFLLFGINRGERWGEYDENMYASRLCLAIDKASGGIVMFEPDMVAGTEFQLMFRSFDLDYMKPKIEELFHNLEGREPLFAMYINCAGRCAGYGGVDIEDAVVLQQTVAGRVPLLGIYTGVEIASIAGEPRGLDWTGVFCLFSKTKEDASLPAASAEGVTAPSSALDTSEARGEAEEMPLPYLARLVEQNAAKVLQLDSQLIAIRSELEQKRRGFKLLAELTVSLRSAASYESVFLPVAQRINAALNMQRTAVLLPNGQGDFYTAVLQGYSPNEITALAAKHFTIPQELFNPRTTLVVTGADTPAYLADLRSNLHLPYFIASPIMLQGELAAVLITGRMVEEGPYLSRLSRSDAETVQAISALLASVMMSQRLKLSEERSQIMLQALPLCCVFWDEQGNLTECNEAALRMFGLDSREFFLQHFYSLAPEVQPERGCSSTEGLRQLVLGAFVDGSASFSWQFRNLAGEIIPTEVTLVRAPQGENYTMVGYIRDLREQEAASRSLLLASEMMEQSTRAKNEFLAAVSHEIRTPLNVLNAMAQEMTTADLAPDLQQLADQSLRASRLLTAAIDGLLDFSQLEAGRLSLIAKPFAIPTLCQGLIAMLQEPADQKGIRLTLSLAEDLPERAAGDVTRLEQALYNLLANGVKFTQEGEVALAVSGAHQPDTGQVHLTFVVRDTGIGIAPEYLDRVFDPLSTADASYTRAHEGLGMGLPVSRSLARMMQGDVTCDSTLGEGSTFTLTVTLDAALQESENLARELLPPLKGLTGMRVLVAEDNVINQMIVENLLERVGISVTLAENGYEALKILQEGERQEPFDVILMDIQMPVMDGLTATMKIREDPRFANIPILAMTAHTAAENREESRRSGMDAHLTKPIDADEVYAALQYWKGRQTP
ncbi:MAG: response regulator [Symbiobacteriaceae bacterium]|nr:response regulator [Symbiobacteriaceae bacterium]